MKKNLNNRMWRYVMPFQKRISVVGQDINFFKIQIFLKNELEKLIQFKTELIKYHLII